MTSQQIYPLYNQDYQNYKKTFNKGLNFRVFSRKDKEHSNLNAPQSIATLHALLENQQVQCLHGGVVILKSHKGKTFKDNGIPLILESDLLNSPITNCPHTIAGIPNPCTKVASVKGSLSKKKVNGEFAILQELINSCKSDKGVGLKVEFKPTKFKFEVA